MPEGNSYDRLVKGYANVYSQKIRRWPSEDVVRFGALINDAEILADMGTGTGRNLAPLLLAVKNKGLVYATDITAEGIKAVVDWAVNQGSEVINPAKAGFDDEEILSADKVKEDDTVIRIPIAEENKKYGCGALFRKTGENSYVYLICRVSDMKADNMPENTFDAIVNWGSIFHLAEEEILNTMNLMKKYLKPDGLLLITFKSIFDSRFELRAVNDERSWRRANEKGDLEGLELEFFDQERTRQIIKGWDIVSFKHILEENVLTKEAFGNFVLIIRAKK